MIDGATAGTEITFQQMLDTTDRLAAKLASLGIGKGTIVAIRLDKKWYWLFALALWRLGATTMVATSLGLDFKAFKVSFFISRDESVDFDGTSIEVTQDWIDEAFRSERYGRVEAFDKENPYPIIALTSGTTGRPKQVPITTDLLIARAERSAARSLTNRPGVFLAGVGTLYGQLWHFIFLMRGWPNCLFLARPEELKNLPAAINRFQIETLSGPPGQIQAALAVAGRELKNCASLKRVSTGGGVVPESLRDQITRVFGWKIFTSYTGTEAGTAIARELVVGEDPRILGHTVAGASVQIVNENDEEVASGEIGAIRVKTDLMVEGYLNNPEATSSAFRNGWFYPGDLGRVLPSGEIYYEGRAGEAVNLAGLKVDPGAVDEVILSHPKVSDCASFGIEVRGELRYLACAVILNGEVEMQELISFAKRELGERRPLIIFTLDSIPRNEMGKIKRSELTKDYSSDLLKIIRASLKR